MLLYALITKYYNNTRRTILGSQEAVRWSHHPIVAMTHRFRRRQKVPDCVNVRIQLFDGWFQKVYESFCDGIFSCSGLHHSHGGHFTSVDGEAGNASP